MVRTSPAQNKQDRDPETLARRTFLAGQRDPELGESWSGIIVSELDGQIRSRIEEMTTRGQLAANPQAGKELFAGVCVIQHRLLGKGEPIQDLDQLLNARLHGAYEATEIRPGQVDGCVKSATLQSKSNMLKTLGIEKKAQDVTWNGMVPVFAQRIYDKFIQEAAAKKK